MNAGMSGNFDPLPVENVGRCPARTHSGALCRSPPLRGSSRCLFHDQRPEVVALMDKARGKGVRREQVIAHLREPMPVELKDADELRAFERAVLKRLLAGLIAPAVARPAVELARSIFEAERRTSRPGRSTTQELLDRIMATPPRLDDDNDTETVVTESAAPRVSTSQG
jgi:hypothetical protein